MGSVNERGNKLFLDFRYKNKRCREYTKLEDNVRNRAKLSKLLQRIDAEILLGTFSYRKYFPASNMADYFDSLEKRVKNYNCQTAHFKDCAEEWYLEKEHSWRLSHCKNIRVTLDCHLLPAFGERPVDQITRSELLSFRARLTRGDDKRRVNGLSPSRINHIMAPLRMILTQAVEKFGFESPWHTISPLRVPKTDVDPFDLDEVNQILTAVRPDFTAYYTVRFFTGMRPAEIDGLQWEYVDFRRRQILIRKALVEGQLGDVKNDGSFREIMMSELVYETLWRHKEMHANTDFVFTNRNGKPLDHREVTRKVWHPLLRYLGLKKRRPYQTRHTAATLWLAAGESPEWIARQMGHTTTEMLFTTYSRFVPNLTRQDGSAFEKLLNQRFR